MDSSRRAVEAYWRSRMVDGVTSDEDKIAPVYKLEEICDLLRTSHVSIVKEVSDYILKRLDHKSPVVKQKALRLIKYAVAKSGTEFRREMQRHSAVMRQLFHYKGQLDPLKRDALNKAVRDTAHEAVSAIFANDDNEPAAPTEGVQKRIQGFGNANFEMPTEEKKSFLSGVVGIGLSTIAAANSIRKSDSGSYRSPNLRRSLTTETGGRDRYEGDDYHSEDHSSSSGSSRNMASGTWGQDLRTAVASTTSNEDTASSQTGIKNREERLLGTIATSGGVRLQPTRDAIQVFLSEALKLDPVGMSHALEVKLQSPLWQVRMKACCVLESILRKKDVEHFSIIASYFSENRDSVVKCSELPQVSLREKANKVLSLLEGDQNGTGNHAESSIAKPTPVPAVQMPDLIDTGDSDDYGTESSMQKNVDQNIGNLMSSGSLVDDLFGDNPVADSSNSENRSEDDPFADVSFHVTEEKQNDDIFSGLTVDKISDHEQKVSKESGLLDLFSSNSDLLQETEANKRNVHDMMAGLSLNVTAQEKQHSGASGISFMGTSFLDGINQSDQIPANQSGQMLMNQSSQMPMNGGLNGSIGSNSFFPMVPMQYNMRPNMMFNPAFANQPMNYASMGTFIAQQQLLFQNLRNLNSSYGQPVGNAMDGGQSSPLPDIFQFSNNPVQNHAAAVISSKKEDTLAFDFISDHFSAARDSKGVL